MDKIFVKNLIVPCRVGVTEEERAKKQNVVIDVEVCCKLNFAAAKGDISKSISYSEIEETITSFVSNGEFILLESIAEGIASLLLKKPISSKAIISVKKEKYSKKPSMGIEISRDRNG